MRMVTGGVEPSGNYIITVLYSTLDGKTEATVLTRDGVGEWKQMIRSSTREISHGSTTQPDADKQGMSGF
jgi:hypothetical protein